MKKLNYDDEKIKELDVWLSNSFKYKRTPDSFEVTATALDRKRIAHFISTLNTLYKTPPLAIQYCENEQIISVFDQR